MRPLGAVIVKNWSGMMPYTMASLVYIPSRTNGNSLPASLVNWEPLASEGLWIRKRLSFPAVLIAILRSEWLPMLRGGCQNPERHWIRPWSLELMSSSFKLPQKPYLWAFLRCYRDIIFSYFKNTVKRAFLLSREGFFLYIKVSGLRIAYHLNLSRILTYLDNPQCLSCTHLDNSFKLSCCS